MIDKLNELHPPMPKNAQYFGNPVAKDNLWDNPVHIPPKLKRYVSDTSKMTKM